MRSFLNLLGTMPSMHAKCWCGFKFKSHYKVHSTQEHHIRILMPLDENLIYYCPHGSILLNSSRSSMQPHTSLLLLYLQFVYNCTICSTRLVKRQVSTTQKRNQSASSRGHSQTLTDLCFLHDKSVMLSCRIAISKWLTAQIPVFRSSAYILGHNLLQLISQI